MCISGGSPEGWQAPNRVREALEGLAARVSVGRRESLQEDFGAEAGEFTGLQSRQKCQRTDRVRTVPTWGGCLVRGL